MKMKRANSTQAIIRKLSALSNSSKGSDKDEALHNFNKNEYKKYLVEIAFHHLTQWQIQKHKKSNKTIKSLHHSNDRHFFIQNKIISELEFENDNKGLEDNKEIFEKDSIS